MDKNEKFSRDYYVVDLAHVVKVVWQRIWAVITISLITAVMGFLLAALAIKPTYSASIMLYVNNSSFNVGDLGFSISSSELTAAQSLAKTYTVLLKNRTTLERLINTCELNYSWEDIYDMIDSSPVDETEVMQVTVTCTDPYEAARIANGIAEILPQRVAEVIEGASMEVVDSAIVNTEKVAPSITLYTAVGFAVGLLLSVATLIIIALMDNTVHDEEYVIRTFGYPILAQVPNLNESSSKRYGYTSTSKSNEGSRFSKWLKSKRGGQH
ncbi:MAG: hypothetical protein IJN04_03565 [Clostridia bacterium]|nr:hypothetical protein [Clostridia bacterium]